MSRRVLQAIAVLSAAGALTLSGAVASQEAAGSGAAQPPAGVQRGAADQPLPDEITPELESAIARGLEWLAARQDPADGSFEGGRYPKNVAVTALACIAFMADGHLPGRGAYGEAVDRGLDYILENSQATGLIANEGANGPMYGHGFATLFLGEVYGVTRGGADTERAKRVHEALVKAVRLIERTQNEEGGWRYNPVPYDADVSVTICQVMALRSARNAGIEVSKEVIDKAVEYVRRCQNGDGGFRYQAQFGPSAWPRSAAGVATLFYAGIYEDRAIDSGMAYLRQTALPGTGRASQAHYFYGQYYAVQAAFLSGGDDWAEWWPAVRAELLEEQSAAGSWNSRSVGTTYGTAMALIVLQMPKRYLPIFQK